MLRKQLRRNSIRTRIRRTVKGTAERPRLSVFRSNKQISAQLIDDIAGVTLVAASSASKDMDGLKPLPKELVKEASNFNSTQTF